MGLNLSCDCLVFNVIDGAYPIDTCGYDVLGGVTTPVEASDRTSFYVPFLMLLHSQIGSVPNQILLTVVLNVPQLDELRRTGQDG